MIVRVGPEPIDAATLLSQMTSCCAEAGAVVSFTGLVRGEEDVQALELQAYPGFTQAQITDEAVSVAQAYGLGSVTVAHRVGRLSPGETIVFVATAAAHRRAAFEAADRLMDYLKTSAPFWKAEHGPWGTRWIEPRAADHADAARWRSAGDAT